jgi:hypothetical protein
LKGLGGYYKLAFATLGSPASPINFSSGSSIGSDSNFASGLNATGFVAYYNYLTYTSPNFGPNSYMGFRIDNEDSTFNYGWLKVTWDGTNFEILGGAYQTTPDTPILAGDTVGGGGGAVPEPASSAVVAMLMGGAALRKWRKNKRNAKNSSFESLAL